MMPAAYFWILKPTECSCPSGYTEISEGVCQKIETISPTITYSNYCLAPSQRDVYSSSKSRIYNSGFSNTSLYAFSAPSGDVYAEMTDVGQWKSSSATNGPMNRAGVWVDSDCDGNKDGLTSGQQLTISYMYENTGAERTVYVGVGGDNLFTLKVNDNIIAQSPDILVEGFTPDQYFTIWHIFPVVLISGVNYFNLIGKGDGSVNDALAMTVYDNTPSQLVAANTDNNTGLSIIFSSESLISEHIDVATCPTGYNLDTSDGQGNYTCTRTLTTNCN